MDGLCWPQRPPKPAADPAVAPVLAPGDALVVLASLASHLGFTPGAALTLLEANDRLDPPVDPDCGTLVLRDLEHQRIGIRLDPLEPAHAWGSSARQALASDAQHRVVRDTRK